jgi:hypothetical protein
MAEVVQDWDLLQSWGSGSVDQIGIASTRTAEVLSPLEKRNPIGPPCIRRILFLNGIILPEADWADLVIGFSVKSRKAAARASGLDSLGKIGHESLMLSDEDVPQI